MGDRFVLLALCTDCQRFPRNENLCRDSPLHKSPSDEIIIVNRGLSLHPFRAYACKKIIYARIRSCSPFQNSMDYGNIYTPSIYRKVARRSCIWLFLRKLTRRSHWRNSSWTIELQKKKTHKQKKEKKIEWVPTGSASDRPAKLGSRWLGA